MGGHGGLNILPQKRWNVYRYDNQEKVRKDEEAAARDESARRADSNRRDSDLRLQRLRGTPAAPTPAPPPSPPPDSGHINLLHGLRGGFDGLVAAADETRSKREAAVVERLGKELGRERKKMKKEAPRTVGPEDEKYRMGYGVAGKGVKAPWYLAPSSVGRESGEEGEGSRAAPERKCGSGKKTMEELREERVRREGKEKERERALLQASARNAAVTDRRGFGSRKSSL